MPHTDQIYKYEPLQFYPHMGPADADIWNKFVIANPNRFNTAIYDMRCGTPEHCDESLPQNIQDAWNDLCRGRIDVVAEDDAAIYVIEVKPRARGEAIGQAIHNAVLYEVENPTDKLIMPTILTDVVLPGTRIVADAKRVYLLHL